jgi:tripartite-type tricarboxylate transporter receptor subunit TctC
VVYFNHLIFKNNGEGLMQFKKSEARQVSQQFLTTKLLRLIWMATIAFVFLQTAVSFAQNFPNRPIKVIVTYPPGGSSDLITRLVGQKLGEHFGTPVLVENKAGAAGSIGMEYATSQPADGYSILVGNLGPIAVNPLISKVNYNVDKQLVPLTMVAGGPNILVVNTKSPYKNLKELLAVAVAKPNTINFGTSGPGSLSQLTSILMMGQAKIKMQEVPYKGGALAVNDILASQIDMIISDAQPVSQHIKAGTLRPLAITSAKRSPLFPDIPTFLEGGLDGMEASNWWGAFIVTGTPKPIMDAYHSALLKILAMPDIKDKFGNLGVEPMPMSQDEAKRFYEAEKTKYAKLVKDNDIKGN